MAKYPPHKIPMTQERADVINRALIGIYDIRAGQEPPEKFDLFQNVLLSCANLQLWLDATNFIDDWNKREQIRAELEDRDPKVVRTLSDKFIAAIYAFICFPALEPIVWDGKQALGIVNVDMAPPAIEHIENHKAPGILQ